MKGPEKSFFFFLFLLLIDFGNKVFAQQSASTYTRQTEYLISLPEGYTGDTTKKWPLLLFLHGSGASGNDLEKVKENGLPKLIANGKKFPFIVVSPQAKEEDQGWDAENLYHFLEYVKHTFRVDGDRVYVTGLSMGGFGTWALAIKHPEEFAAIIPIAGGGDSSMAWRLRHTPVWCFHGALDTDVPIPQDEQMVNALRRYNPNVRFTVYPAVYS